MRPHSHSELALRRADSYRVRLRFTAELNSTADQGELPAFRAAEGIRVYVAVSASTPSCTYLPRVAKSGPLGSRSTINND